MTAPVQTSSFQRRSKPGSFNIPGTKISATYSGLYISTGVSSLDNVIDGGIPVGGLCLIEEDEYGSYSKMISKYFLADGFVHGNFLFHGTALDDPWELMHNLPSPTKETSSNLAPAETKEELKIAWRYENLSLDSNQGKSGDLSFDLSAPVKLENEHKEKISVWEGLETQSTGVQSGIIKSSMSISLIENLVKTIKNRDLSKNLLRIAITSLGSSQWCFGEHHESDFTATLILLKSLLRSVNAVAVVTIPHYLLKPAVVARAGSIADVVIRLKALREDRYLQDLMDVHGILEVKKVVNLFSLKPILGHEGTTTYGFKATKRKFKIEKLHLPPSLEVDPSSPANLGASSGGCGTAGRSKLDF